MLFKKMKNYFKNDSLNMEGTTKRQPTATCKQAERYEELKNQANEREMKKSALDI